MGQGCAAPLPDGPRRLAQHGAAVGAQVGRGRRYGMAMRVPHGGVTVVAGVERCSWGCGVCGDPNPVQLMPSR